MVVAEAMDAVLAGEIGLLLADFWKAQVVVAEVCGEMGLVVAGEERGGSGHVAPLSETRAPPLVVFRDRVVLGEVEGEKIRLHLSAKGEYFSQQRESGATKATNRNRKRKRLSDTILSLIQGPDGYLPNQAQSRPSCKPRGIDGHVLSLAQDDCPLPTHSNH